jgi:prepilin-type N-terminal cleavage/methylation domain-containing protein
MKPTSAHAAAARAGFTLVEMLVVIVILAIVTTIAVRSIDTLQDQGRFDGTRQGLREIDEAVAGVPGQLKPDGTALITGFVADMGRLPAVIVGEPLQELWVKPPASGLFTIVAAPSDPEVLVETGWRGPYLRLGPGTASLRDGWGNPFVVRAPDGTTPPAGAPIAAVASLGADNTAGGTEYDGDLDVKFEQTAPALNRWSGSLTVEVVVFSASSMGPPGNPQVADGNVEIKYFGPNGTGAVVELTSGSLVPSGTGPVTYTFTGVPVGPRVVRAYQGTLPTIYRSLPTRVVVPPGGSLQRVVILKP